jgi:GMP synthase-like glutamine amidotransferase
MRLHYFQHVPQEGLGTIEEWAKKRGWTITKTSFFAGEPIPRLEDIDWLVVMGGPMSVNDEHTLAWLKPEKQFIASVIQAGKTVLGFCLGSQLIANALGAKVQKNKYKEIGWYELRFTEKGRSIKALSRFPERLTVYQWHGETFDVPIKATLAATNEICMNQALIFGERVIGMQFHLEVTRDDVAAWIKHGPEDLTNDRYVQTPEKMLDDKKGFAEIKKHMNYMLDDLAGNSK